MPAPAGRSRAFISSAVPSLGVCVAAAFTFPFTAPLDAPAAPADPVIDVGTVIAIDNTFVSTDRAVSKIDPRFLGLSVDNVFFQDSTNPKSLPYGKSDYSLHFMTAEGRQALHDLGMRNIRLFWNQFYWDKPIEITTGMPYGAGWHMGWRDWVDFCCGDPSRYGAAAAARPIDLYICLNCTAYIDRRDPTQPYSPSNLKIVTTNPPPSDAVAFLTAIQNYAASRGFTMPLRAVEIGNETYSGQDGGPDITNPDPWARPWMRLSPQEYRDRANALYAAIKTAHPNVKVGINWLSMLGFPSRDNPWGATVKDAAHDFLSAHDYWTFNDLWVDNARTAARYSFNKGFSDGGPSLGLINWDFPYATRRQTVQNYGMSPTEEIWMTEFNLLQNRPPNLTGGWPRDEYGELAQFHNRSMVWGALSVTETMLDAVRWTTVKGDSTKYPGAKKLFFHTISTAVLNLAALLPSGTSPSDVSLRTMIHYPLWNSIRMIAPKIAGHKWLVNPAVTNPVIEPESGEKALRCWAIQGPLNGTDRTIYVVVINHHAVNAVRVDFAFTNFTPVSGARSVVGENTAAHPLTFLSRNYLDPNKADPDMTVNNVRIEQYDIAPKKFSGGAVNNVAIGAHTVNLFEFHGTTP